MKHLKLKWKRYGTKRGQVVGFKQFPHRRMYYIRNRNEIEIDIESHQVDALIESLLKLRNETR